jgi:transcriptional regulator with XRE-family HTH domain
MPSTSPALTPQTSEDLASLGAALRLRRKELRVSAVVAAEAAGLSRVTLHRIEKGEPSVTMGAYMAVFAVLGLDVQLSPQGEKAAPATTSRSGWIPARVRLADFPKLKELAWQVHGTGELSPREALDVYERNWRHLDAASLSAEEADLLDSLRRAFESNAGV